MKTPRELLLQRHEAALPRLDALRARAGGFQPPSVAQAIAADGDWKSPAPASLWERLFGPNPLAWAGLAAAWLVLLAVNYSGRNPASSADIASRASQPSEAAVAEIVRERRREMAELLNLDEPRAAQPARDTLPPKRSQWREDFAVV
jgi:hypothetical protein